MHRVLHTFSHNHATQQCTCALQIKRMPSPDVVAAIHLRLFHAHGQQHEPQLLECLMRRDSLKQGGPRLKLCNQLSQHMHWARSWALFAPACAHQSAAKWFILAPAFVQTQQRRNHTKALNATFSISARSPVCLCRRKLLTVHPHARCRLQQSWARLLTASGVGTRSTSETTAQIASILDASLPSAQSIQFDDA